VSAADRWDVRPAAREEEGTPSAVETLREAARLMRERAETVVRPLGHAEVQWHYAAWRPAVALAIADWLENVAAWIDEGLGRCDDLYQTNYPDAWNDQREAALTVARVYLARVYLGGDR
jgi:hypothetical protein